jgi:hypothetical protein
MNTSESWKAALSGLSGEFRSSLSEKMVARFFAVLMLYVAASSLWAQFQKSTVNLDPLTRIFFVTLSSILATGGVSLLRLYRERYLFDRGKLTAIAGHGRVLWTEDIASIEATKYSLGRNVDSLTLKSSDHKRVIHLYRSMKMAIKENALAVVLD